MEADSDFSDAHMTTTNQDFSSALHRRALLVANFRALPEAVQQRRLALINGMHDRLRRLDRLFNGLFIVALALFFFSWFFPARGGFFASLATGGALLGVFVVYLGYRGRVIENAARYLDPDTTFDL